MEKYQEKHNEGQTGALEIEALLRAGQSCLAERKAAEAVVIFRRALKIVPSARIHYYLGGALIANGDAAAAMTHFDAALASDALSPPTHLQRARALMMLGRTPEAQDAARTAVRLAPEFAAAWQMLGDVLTAQGRTAEAFDCLRRAVALAPGLHREWLMAAGDFLRAAKFSDVIVLCRRVIETGAPSAIAFRMLGDAHRRLHHAAEAERAYRDALNFDPGNADILYSLGDVLTTEHCHEDALAAYAEALRQRPDFLPALEAHGHRLCDLGRYEEAERDYDALRRCDPKHPWAVGRLLATRRIVCDWRDHDALLVDLTNGLQNGSRRLWPFESLYLLDDPALQYKVMHDQIADFRPRISSAPIRIRPHKKIRVGYLSGDFHAHATVYLIAGLLEKHDRSRFHITAISCGPTDDASAGRQRILSATDAFLQLPPSVTDREVARIIAEQELDILVDLSGFTVRGRPMALSYRPAPIQVNYLGFPGTLGDGFIDYILADRIVIPPGCERDYAENVVRLPHSYQPNTLRTPAAAAMSRAELGLPENGIVFCCFNTAFKLNPATFTAWMNILRACDTSVLWLLVPPDIMASLKQTAASHGISPDRLVLAPNLPVDRHLARLAQADILLDTWPYGAHTTASDALFMGVPVVTWTGRTFASRVATSLLTAIGLPELSARSPEEFERLAIALAHNPDRLRAIKTHLGKAKQNAPLFDIARTTRSVEYAFERMFERALAGEPPEAFDIPEDF